MNFKDFDKYFDKRVTVYFGHSYIVGILSKEKSANEYSQGYVVLTDLSLHEEMMIKTSSIDAIALLNQDRQ
jgi:hypothetical protein